MENIVEKTFKDIEGWGVDANPENNPTYPMRERENEEYKSYSWPRPPQQPVNTEILHSNERPNVSAVFGTSTPPSGLSGAIRRYAFKHSESRYAHWLPLILADRVNMVEGIIDDLKHGHIPNIIKERGWTAEWKYNRTNLLKKVATGVLLTSAIAAALIYSNKRKSKSLF
jgi:hypothetical protein